MLDRYNPLRHLVRRTWPLPAFRAWDDDIFTCLWKGWETLGTEEPEVTFTESKKSYLLRAEMPGYDRDEVKAEVKDGVLTLRAEHQDEKWDQNEDEGWRSIETRHGSFCRSIPLPEDVAVEKISGEMKKGVLRLTLPKIPGKAKESRQIAIQ